MKRYILFRFMMLLPLFIGITICVFSLIKSLPGDPTDNLAGERSSPEAISRIRMALGDRDGVGGVIGQYIGYLKLLIHGNLGTSYYTGRDVFTEIREKLPNTIMLASLAMLFAAPIGIGIGLFWAILGRRYRYIRLAIELITIGGVSVPVFWSALILMLLFGLYLRWLPPCGSLGFRYFILPALTLAIPSSVTIARIARTTILDILKEPFITTARAKGLTRARINFAHILRNAIVPIATIIGLDFGSYLNGSVVTETIFGIDGLGRYTMEAITMRDYPVIMGCIITGTIVFVLVNLATDLLYHILDPRVRSHEG